MQWLALFAALARVLVNLSAMLRDRRARAAGWREAVDAGLRDVDERARKAEVAAASSRADPDLLRDDGHRRDEPAGG